jgi:prepilin-type N-terminal cleavage/methylation domain-containing protein
MRAKTFYRGFSLIELIYVMIVTGMLLSLAVQSIFQSRATARRNICINNMRQLGLALHNYHDVYRKFPLVSNGEPLTEQVAGSTDEGSQRDEFSWIVRVLPYLEEGNLYNELSKQSNRFRGAAFDPSLSFNGAHFASVEIASLRCPAYTGSPRANAKEYAAFNKDEGNKKTGVAISNYAATTATHLALVASTPTNANGIIVPGKATSMASARDGTSRTLLLAESREDGYSSWYGSTGTWVVALPTSAPDPVASAAANAAVVTAVEADNKAKVFRIKEKTPSPINFGPTTADKNRVYLEQGKWPNAGPRTWGPSSEHEGIAVHCFADVAVRPLSGGIDPSVYIALVTRAGNEQINERDVK